MVIIVKSAQGVLTVSNEVLQKNDTEAVKRTTSCNQLANKSIDTHNANYQAERRRTTIKNRKTKNNAPATEAARALQTMC